jgi:hypothetical protein
MQRKLHPGALPSFWNSARSEFKAVPKWKEVLRAIVIRFVAILLLGIACGEVYACELSDACISIDGNGSSDDCDQPAGDNCVCCCHHVMPPVHALALETIDIIDQERPRN